MRALQLLSGFALVLGFAAASPAVAQEFGQNKITYQTFDWSVYHSPHFDVHYYSQEKQLLEECVAELESAYLDLSKRLDHDIRERTPVVLYRTHTEFEQTNIDLGEIPESVGGFSEPFQNRLVIPIDEPPDRRYKLVRHELTHIFQFDIFYAGSIRRAIRSQAPGWLMEGMASYLADDEDTFDQMTIRDAVVNNEVPSVKDLDVPVYATYRFGHAIFDFIETTYGAQGLRNFLFEYRKVLLTPNPEKAFQNAFGLSLDQFDRRFARFLRQRYLPILESKRAPEDYGKEIGITKPGRFTFSPALSPSGELIAALATPSMLKLDVVILSAKDGKIIRNLTRGFTNKYDDIATAAFPLLGDVQRDLTWSPDANRLAFFVKKENYRQLWIYEVLTGRHVDTITIKDISSCAAPAFSPDGKSIAFSGNKDGYWDIFRLDLETRKIENVTQDEYYDTNPSWSADGKTILYDRRIGAFEKVFTVAVGAPERKSQLTGGAASDTEPVFSKDGKWIYFTSDRGTYGVFNLHRMDLATGRIDRITDLTTAAFAPAEMGPAEDGTPQLAYSAYFGGTFRLYRMKVGGAEVDRAVKVGQSEPQSSPLAPSRRAAFQAANKARAAAELAPPVEGTAKPVPGAPPPVPTPQQPPPNPETVGGAVPPPQQPVPPPAEKPPEVTPEGPPATGESPDADLVPFRAPLQLGFDPKRNEKYKIKWALEAPDFTIGVANDGTILSNAAVQFADLLGNQRIIVHAYSVSSYSNFDVTYLNLTRRFDWGARVLDYRDYYVVNGGGFLGSQRIQRANRYTELSGFAAYPLNRHYRLEGALGYAQRRLDYPQIDPATGLLTFQSFSDDYPLASVALVGDTTRYQYWGPFQGYRFRVEYDYLHFTKGDSKGESVTGITLDYRGYQHVTRRSLIALHLAAIRQTGSRGSLISLGGNNQLRGYDFREFVGNNVMWANLEYRFPLIDQLLWGFGLPMGPFRGFLFADVGTAWFDNSQYLDCTNLESCLPILTGQQPPVIATGKATYDPVLGIMRKYQGRENGFLNDIKASAGLGFQVPIFGLPATWSFAKVYDGKHFGSYRSAFYIVFDW